MRRAFAFALAFVLATGLYSMLPAVAAAAGDSTNCATAGHYLVIWEFSGYQSDQTHCAIFAPADGSVENLKFLYYGESGNDGNGVCNGQGPLSHWTWNDCASSFRIRTSCHYPVTLYSDSLYSGVLYYSEGSLDRSSLPVGYDNALSSVEYGPYRRICPAEPAP